MCLSRSQISKLSKSKKVAKAILAWAFANASFSTLRIDPRTIPPVEFLKRYSYSGTIAPRVGLRQQRALGDWCLYGYLPRVEKSTAGAVTSSGDCQLTRSLNFSI